MQVILALNENYRTSTPPIRLINLIRMITGLYLKEAKDAFIEARDKGAVTFESDDNYVPDPEHYPNYSRETSIHELECIGLDIGFRGREVVQLKKMLIEAIDQRNKPTALVLLDAIFALQAS